MLNLWTGETTDESVALPTWAELRVGTCEQCGAEHVELIQRRRIQITERGIEDCWVWECRARCRAA